MTDKQKTETDHGKAQVAAKLNADLDKGYHGVDDDPLKPDGYTLLGSVARSENQ